MIESRSSTTKLHKNRCTIVFCIFFLSLVMCIRTNTREISTQPNFISCEYVGLSEQNDRPVVNLVFKNNTGQNLKSVFGGLSIINKNCQVIQRTGFTYSLLFFSGEEKQIPAFVYTDIQDDALHILSTATDFIPMVFELNEVIFENDQSLTF